MTNVVSNNAASSENKVNKWHMYLYGKDMPVDTEVQDRSGSHIRSKIFGGEKVLFGVTRVLEGFTKRGAAPSFKFVWKMMNYCSRAERIKHTSAVYRGLSFGVFNPITAKYHITGTKLDGEYVNGDKELVEYFTAFIDDAINNYIYDKEKTFDGSELLVTVPSMFKAGNTAQPTTPKEVVKKAIPDDLDGVKIFEVSVDGSKKKYPVKRMRNMNMLGIVTEDKLIAFSLYDLGTFVDDKGFHTNVDHTGKTLDVRSNSMENFKAFKEIYCETL